MSEIRVWKNVFESDLPAVAGEIRETLKSPCVILLTGPVGANI